MQVYQSITDAGDSYNLSALGAYMNERFKPSLTSWVPTYLQTYVVSMQGYVPGVPAGNPAAAHQASRAAANAGIPANGSVEFNTVRDAVIDDKFQRTPAGAGFYDNSKLTHFDVNINAADWLLLGANFRNYSIHTDGTIFNEELEDPSQPYDANSNKFQRISINEYGAYAQVRKKLMEDIMFTGSVRYDKNENFEGRVSPRLSLVYSFAKNSHIRVSYQTGFRNPDTQAQYIYFPSSSGTILGTAKANAEQYGVMEGGAYSAASYQAYVLSGGVLDSISGVPTGGTPSVLATENVSYVKPERLSAYEIGYKGLIGDNFMADVNYYSTNYRDFLSSKVVAIKQVPTETVRQKINPGQLFSLYSNAEDLVKSWGVGVGLTWHLPEGFVLAGNYSYADLKVDYSSEGSNFLAYFNTPKNMYGFTFSNREMLKNLGFSASFRTASAFMYESSFAIWEIPAYSVLDAQVSYKIESMKTILKLGGNNIGIGSGDYRTRPGGPYVGKLWYVTLTFDEFLN